MFDRLFDDYHEREDRFNEMKTHLEKLEALHWEEVLSILHLYDGKIQNTYVCKIINIKR